MEKANSNIKQVAENFFDDFYSKKVKGGVKTDVFHTFERKSYLEIRGISEELFDRLCEPLDF